MNRSPGLHFGSRRSWSSRKHLNYMRDEACQVWGLRATIVAMRPLALTTPHTLWPFRRWRARPTPWSSDLKLGSLNLTPIPCKCSATVRPSGQKAVAGIVHSRYKPLLRNFLTRARSVWKASGGLLEGFWHVVWGGSRPLRRGRRVRGPPRGVSGGVDVPFEGQAAVLRSLLKCKV